MKVLILATATIVALSNFAIAREPIAAKDAQDAGATFLARGSPKASAVQLAMGPTSAPHLPGGTGEGSNVSSSKPSGHKKSKHRHKHS